jgi:hypothetical protein
MRARPRLRGRCGTTATPEATAELGLEVAGGTALALLASVTSAVTVTVTTAAATTASTAPLAVLAATEHTTGRSRTLLLDVGLGHDLGGQVEPLAEVVETLRGEGVVVVLP